MCDAIAFANARFDQATTVKAGAVCIEAELRTLHVLNLGLTRASMLKLQVLKLSHGMPILANADPANAKLGEASTTKRKFRLSDFLWQWELRLDWR